jgi:hypothetical protein
MTQKKVSVEDCKEKLTDNLLGLLVTIDDKSQSIESLRKEKQLSRELQIQINELSKLQGIYEGVWNSLQIVSPGSFDFLNPLNLFSLLLILNMNFIEYVYDVVHSFI